MKMLVKTTFLEFNNTIQYMPTFISLKDSSGVSICLVGQKEESFYTISWACSTDGTPFVVAGGINGIIRVIDAGSEKIHKVINGF